MDDDDTETIMALDYPFLDDLIGIVGATHVRRDNELALMDPGVDPQNLEAGLAVRPGSTDEVSQILALCNQTGVPVVAQGGRTGLSRSATTAPGQLILMTDRFDRMEIDVDDRVAEVGAGVTLQALQEAAAVHNLSPGIDIAARGSARIGGMISTNAGGMEAFRFGMMRHRVLGIEAVLADGSVLSDLARVTKNNEGYHLGELFCGAEGTLGVVTRATIRLERADPLATTMILAADSAAAARGAMRALEATGGLLRAEIMWRDYAQVCARECELTHVLAFCDAPVYAIYDVSGGQDAVIEAIAPMLEDGTVSDAVIAQSDREAADIWRIREDSFAANRAIAHPLWFDISLPLSKLDAYVHGLGPRVREIRSEVEVHAIGHLADGNLHLTVGSADPWTPQEKDTVAIAVEAGVKAAGGSVSAEHGIGRTKLATLARNASPEKLAVMRRMKAALDLNGIMNPGKVIPA